VEYPLNKASVTAVDRASFTIKEGGVLGIIGESGSGKTSIALAIMKLHNKDTRIQGSIHFQGEDIGEMSHKKLNQLRWKRVSLVYQNHLDVLNPVLTVQEQILEAIRKHLKLNGDQRRTKLRNLCNMVNLEEKWMEEYPHQLSGGMRQKVLIAMALACDPELLIVDEPTTALDALGKEEMLKLLQRLQQQNKFSMLLISHDLYVINQLSNNIIVMYEGKILEEGITKEVVENPMHVYTKGLLDASLEINPYQDLWGIPDYRPSESSRGMRKKEGESHGENDGNAMEEQAEISPSGCVFRNRCYQRAEICESRQPELKYVSIERQVACNFLGIKTLLNAKNIYKTYESKAGEVVACKNCSLQIRSGEIIAMIGESGSGKTTFANIVSGMLQRDSGTIEFQGEVLQGNNFIRRKNGVQVVFQDPFSATNGRFSIEEIVSEPLDLLGEDSRKDIITQAKNALFSVGLSTDPDFLQRKCSSLSGGQRQRLAIARALVMKPKLLIADEISSMLDPSTKANVLRLLKGLQNQYGFAMLYITHELSLARKISNKVCIMYQGEIIEQGSVQKVFNQPETSYGKSLLKKLSAKS